MTLYTSEIVARVRTIADKSAEKILEEGRQEVAQIESSIRGSIRGRLLYCFFPHLLRQRKEQIMWVVRRQAVMEKGQIWDEYYAKVGAPVPVGEAEECREYELELQASRIRPPAWHQRLTDRGVVNPGDPY